MIDVLRTPTDDTQSTPSSIRKCIEENGFALAKGVFTPDEIAALREEVHEFFRTDGRCYDFGKTQPDAMSRIPSLRRLIVDNRMLDLARAAAGRDDIQFTFHSDAHQNMLSGWHTDTQAYFSREESSPADFEVHKIGIYLQDHSSNKQGLTVVPGSHRDRDLRADAAEALSTGVGDVVIFDVRIFHHGDKKQWHERVLRKVLGNESAAYTAGTVLRKLTGRADKLSIFFTYGWPNEHTREFALRNMKRQISQNGNASRDGWRDAAELLRHHGVPFADIESLMEEPVRA